MNSSKPLTVALKPSKYLRFGFLPRLSQTRLYHSYEHDPPPPFSTIEESILSRALQHVPAHGFTLTALTQGARDTGYLDVSANLFNNDPFSIVNYHLVKQRLTIAEHSLEKPQSSQEVSSNIKTIALRRLQANRPIIHRWQEALALLSTARHLPTAVRELARLSDEILFRAGSTTVTTAWYTDRAALSAIYASAETFMTTDTSKDFTETDDFLTRRLVGAEKGKNFLQGVGAWAGMQAGGLIDGLRSKGIWI